MEIKYRKNKIMNDIQFWDAWWEKVDPEGQKETLKWSGYIPALKKFVNKNDIILEAGCGLGSALSYFEKVNKIIGLDFVYKPLKLIRPIYKNVPLVNGNCLKTSFKDNSFDIYLSFGVIEHFEYDYENILKEAIRITKPEKYLFISVPYLNLFRKIKYFFNNLNENNDNFDFYYFTKKDLKKLVKRNNCQLKKIYYCNKLTYFYKIYMNLINMLFKKKQIKSFQKGTNSTKLKIKDKKLFKINIVKQLMKKIVLFIDKILPGIFFSHMILIVIKKTIMW